MTTIFGERVVRRRAPRERWNGRFSPEIAMCVIFTALWMRGPGYFTVYSLTSDKSFLAAGTEQAASPIASLVSQGSYLAVLAACGVAVVFRINEVPRPGLWRIAVMLVPWVWLLARNAFSGVVTADTLLYPFVILAVAALRPHPRVLAYVGGLVGVTAFLAIVLGLFAPEAGIVRESDGEIRVRADKELIPGIGLLQGMFPSENTLALFLSVGIVSILLIRTTWWRNTCLAMSAVALLWSSSRGGLLTAGGLIVAGVALHWLLRNGLRRLASTAARAGAMIAFVAAAGLPFLGWDDDAFSARGQIWNVAIAEWTERSLWYGLGPGWFARMAATETSPLHEGAYHAHNDMLQMIVSGGLVLAVLFIGFFVVIAWDVTSPRSDTLWTAGMLVVAIALSGAMEATTGFVDASSQWLAAMVPLAIVFFHALPQTPEDWNAPLRS